MSNYSNNPNQCRVDVFKTSGKWYGTIEVIFRSEDFEKETIHQALKNAIIDTDRKICSEFMYICLEPYHKYSHPIIVQQKGYRS